jgi:hypothetical protein
MEGVPAALATSPDETKMPEPMVVPTAIARADQKPSFRVSVPLLIRDPPHSIY